MNIVSINRKKILEILILTILPIMMWVFYSRHTIYTIVDSSFYDLLTTIKIVLIILLLLIMIFKIVCGDYTILHTITYFALILFVALLSYRRETLNFIDYYLNCDILIYVVFCIVCKDINYRRIIKTIFLSLLLINISFLIGIFLHNIVNQLQYRADGYANRYSLGRSASAEFSFIEYYIMLYYCYLRNKFITKRELAVLIVLSLVIYYLTNTRLNFLLSILFLSAIIALRIYNVKFLSKFTFALMVGFIVIVPICYLWLSYIYSSDIFLLERINQVLSGRLSLNQNVIYSYGINLLSNDFIPTMAKGYYDVIDSGFLGVLLDYGIIFYLVLVAVLIGFDYMIYKNNDKYLFIVYAFSLFDMLFNHSIRYFQFNFLLFILSYKYSYFISKEKKF